MNPLVSAVAGALVVAGVLGVAAGLRPVPAAAPARTRRRSPRSVSARVAGLTARTKILAAAGLTTGVVVYLLTGWLIAVAVAPAVVLGLPALLAAAPATARIDKLQAMEEWTRALAGVLTVGLGLEKAIRATLRSTPAPVRVEVTALVDRLRAGVPTEDALRGFADDLDDATGDLVAAYLILGARRGGQGLAAVLESLAESVAADVRARRQIEADRAKPRTTTRWVTIIAVAVLGVLALTGDYISPYRTGVGQMLLAGLLAAYIALLLWMRRMATGTPLPRFLGAAVRDGAHR